MAKQLISAHAVTRGKKFTTDGDQVVTRRLEGPEPMVTQLVSVNVKPPIGHLPQVGCSAQLALRLLSVHLKPPITHLLQINRSIAVVTLLISYGQRSEGSCRR